MLQVSKGESICEKRKEFFTKPAKALVAGLATSDYIASDPNSQGKLVCSLMVSLS